MPNKPIYTCNFILRRLSTTHSESVIAKNPHTTEEINYYFFSLLGKKTGLFTNPVPSYKMRIQLSLGHTTTENHIMMVIQNRIYFDTQNIPPRPSTYMEIKTSSRSLTTKFERLSTNSTTKVHEKKSYATMSNQGYRIYGHVYGKLFHDVYSA